MTTVTALEIGADYGTLREAVVGAVIGLEAVCTFLANDCDNLSSYYEDSAAATLIDGHRSELQKVIDSLKQTLVQSKRERSRVVAEAVGTIKGYAAVNGFAGEKAEAERLDSLAAALIRVE